ncbi:MAG: hypothetical protein QOE14_2976, partial [Humisphaera sp.]|nr:hypothetical protein [Humisphaera sp.]
MARKAATKRSADQHEYPRMQLRRANWTNLSGKWDFAIDATAQWTAPRQVEFDRTIVVPFAPETPASGVEETGFFDAVWYRRTFRAPRLEDGQRLILHFGAVDYEASVWVNDSLAARHEGGYTPFSADITDLLDDGGGAGGAGGAQTIVVRAFDDPHDLAKPRGKQDWQLEPHSIWYFRTTGIWQTVWMEVVPQTRIASLQWTPCVREWAFDFSARVAGPVRDGLKLRLRLSAHGKELTHDAYSLSDREILRRIALPDPGIEDHRNDLLWWPDRPNLIEAEI